MPDSQKNNPIYIFITIVILSVAAPALAGDSFMTLSTTAVRRMALASPAALEGYAAENPVNPAGFNLFSQEYEPKFEVFFNPLGAIIAAQGLQNGPEADGRFDGKDIFIPLFLLLKGINISYHPFDMGLVFAEQSQFGRQSDKFFEYFSVFEDYYNRFFLQLELHQKVAVGISADIFTQQEKIRGVGWSYGVLIKPGKLSVGVFYYMLPGKYREALLPVDRIVEDTVNAGLAWQPWRFLKCYLDLRNLSEENQPAFLEPHMGIETYLGQHTALRAGYYRADNERDVLSLGIGILDLNSFRSLDEKSNRKEYLLDYAVTYNPKNEDTLHALSVYFRL